MGESWEMCELKWPFVSSSVQCGACLLAGRRVSSQNLIGSELSVSRSVCARLAPNLLQVVDLNRIFEIGWVKAGRCVNSSGNFCQVSV